MKKAGYGGSRHKDIARDQYNKKRKGRGIKDEVEEGVTGPTRMEIQKFFDKTKGTLRGRLNATASAFNIYEIIVNKEGTVVGYQLDKRHYTKFKEELQLTEAQKKDAVGRKSIKDRMKDQDKVMGILKGKKKPYKEEAPANKTGVNVVGTGDDPTVWKRKKKKVKTEQFGGNKVFIVSGQRFYNSRLGKARYARYEKYVGNDDVGEAIRLYGRTNPKLPIILKNSENGAMLYLKYGNKR